MISVVIRTALGEYGINELLLARPTVAAQVLEQLREAGGRDFAPDQRRRPADGAGVGDPGGVAGG